MEEEAHKEESKPASQSKVYWPQNFIGILELIVVFSLEEHDLEYPDNEAAPLRHRKLKQKNQAVPLRHLLPVTDLPYQEPDHPSTIWGVEDEALLRHQQLRKVIFVISAKLLKTLIWHVETPAADSEASSSEPSSTTARPVRRIAGGNVNIKPLRY